MCLHDNVDCIKLLFTVILMGAHTVGHTNISNSGYGFLGDTSNGLLNAWDDTPGLFDNHYYSNLMDRVSAA